MTDPPGDIEPDVKDWTWVVECPCPECGVDVSGVALADVAATIRATVVRWRDVLDRPDVRVRPRPGTWSPLEYAAHVRDVHRLSARRLAAMVAVDGARFDDWDQDAAALGDRYDLQDPAEVADDLVDAAGMVADGYDSVPPSREGHRGVRSNGSEFTVLTFGRYHLHDVLHHLHDVGG